MVKKSSAPKTEGKPAKKPAFKAPVDGETGEPVDVDTGTKSSTAWGASIPPSDPPADPPKESESLDNGEAAAELARIETEAARIEDERQQAPAAAPAPETGWDLSGQEVPVNAEEAEKVKTARQAKADREAPPAPPSEIGGNISAIRKDLITSVERIERITEEISGMREDIKEEFAKLKAKGYTTAIIRKAISRRAMDPEKRRENDALLDLYEAALNGD